MGIFKNKPSVEKEINIPPASIDLVTAEQMYQYCIDNSLGSGQNKKWGIKHFSQIASSLLAGERTLMCFIGLRNYESATKHENNFAFAITDKRIIMAQEKMLSGAIIHTVMRDNINDIKFDSGMAFGIITIDARGEKFNIAVNKSVASNIFKTIHQILFSSNMSIEAESLSSPQDEILKYKKLFDDGVLTEEEFQLKKKQILGI